jgi:hypothetical protein
MRDLLLAYLFGELGVHERERVERALADEPELQAELSRLQQSLRAAADEAISCEPPAGLAERTCERVARVVRGERVGLFGRCWARMPLGASMAGAAGAATASWSSASRCSAGDLASAVAVTLVLATLIFPAIHDSRVLARRYQCQQNLAELNLGISAYAASHGGRIPHVPAAGRDAFAGIFPVLLADFHFIDRELLGQLLICPGTIRGEDWRQEGFQSRLRVPTYAEVMTASDESLQAWRRQLAGSFAYRFGFVDEYGRYCEWRLDYKPRSAILSDTPSLALAGYLSANHGGDGQNVVFADGHAEYLVECTALTWGDHLFLNSAGQRAAPRGTADNVLGRSQDGPGVELLHGFRGLLSR